MFSYALHCCKGNLTRIAWLNFSSFFGTILAVGFKERDLPAGGTHIELEVRMLNSDSWYLGVKRDGLVQTAKRIQNGYKREIHGGEKSIYCLQGHSFAKKWWLNSLIIPWPCPKGLCPRFVGTGYAWGEILKRTPLTAKTDPSPGIRARA